MHGNVWMPRLKTRTPLSENVIKQQFEQGKNSGCKRNLRKRYFILVFEISVCQNTLFRLAPFACEAPALSWQSCFNITSLVRNLF